MGIIEWYNKKIKRLNILDIAAIKAYSLLIGMVIGAYVSGFVQTYLPFFITIIIVLIIELMYKVFKR